MKKRYGLLFLVISSVKNLTGELINFQKVFRQKLEVITSFLLHVIGCWKQNFEKKGNLSNKGKRWPIFSVLSSVTNVREHLRKIHKVFCQLLWKLWELFFQT